MQNPKGCWRQCAAAALALFSAVGLNVNVFSVYLPYLTKIGGLTHSQVSSFATIRSLFCCIIILVVRQYYVKLDVRRGFTLAVLISVVAYVLFGCCSQYWLLCIGAALGGISFGLGGMYAASILIHRWFPVSGEGTALGICSASTGVASTVCAPLITAVAEHFSAQTAFLAQAAVMLLCAVCSFLLICDHPQGVKEAVETERVKYHFRFDWMILAIFGIGGFGILGYQYVSMHYTIEGFDPYRVSLLVSVVGLALTVGKFCMGYLMDRWGAVKANRLAFGEMIAGCLLFCVGSRFGYVPAILAVALFGLGNCSGTVGLTVYAEDLAKPEDFAATVQLYQFAYPFGALLMGQLPGWIADRTGSYGGFYAMLAGMALFALIVIRLCYRKKETSKV